MTGPSETLNKLFAERLLATPAGSGATLSDLWQARLAVKTLRRDQREPIAEAGE